MLVLISKHEQRNTAHGAVKVLTICKDMFVVWDFGRDIEPYKRNSQLGNDKNYN